MSMRLGGGGRFAALEGKLSSEPGVRNPGALAASIGRKKYGAKGMSAMSHHGTAGAPVARKFAMRHMFGGGK